MKTIVLCAFKGGSCRTSSTLHLGAALAKFHDKKVLLVDFDAQANLSMGLGFGADQEVGIVSVLQEKIAICDAIRATNVSNLHLITANTHLDQIETTSPLVGDSYNHERLKLALQPLDFDFCFIDIPPSFGWLCKSAFYASQYSLVCAHPEPYSVLALQRLADHHQMINKRHAISILGVLLTKWDERGAINRAILDGVEQVFPHKLCKAKIRRDTEVNKAILEGLPIFETAPQSRAAHDYKALTEELIERFEEMR